MRTSVAGREWTRKTGMDYGRPSATCPFWESRRTVEPELRTHSATSVCGLFGRRFCWVRVLPRTGVFSAATQLNSFWAVWLCLSKGTRVHHLTSDVWALRVGDYGSGHLGMKNMTGSKHTKHTFYAKYNCYFSLIISQFWKLKFFQWTIFTADACKCPALAPRLKQRVQVRYNYVNSGSSCVREWNKRGFAVTTWLRAYILHPSRIIVADVERMPQLRPAPHGFSSVIFDSLMFLHQRKWFVWT